MNIDIVRELNYISDSDSNMEIRARKVIDAHKGYKRYYIEEFYIDVDTGNNLIAFTHKYTGNTRYIELKEVFRVVDSSNNTVPSDIFTNNILTVFSKLYRLLFDDSSLIILKYYKDAYTRSKIAEEVGIYPTMRIDCTKTFKKYFDYRYAIESYGLGTVHIYDSAESGESEVTSILECIGVPAGTYSDSGRITQRQNVIVYKGEIQPKEMLNIYKKAINVMIDLEEIRPTNKSIKTTQKFKNTLDWTAV